MVFICLALCLLNTALCLYLLKERRKSLPMTEEDERNEAERRGKEDNPTTASGPPPFTQGRLRTVQANEKCGRMLSAPMVNGKRYTGRADVGIGPYRGQRTRCREDAHCTLFYVMKCGRMLSAPTAGWDGTSPLHREGWKIHCRGRCLHRPEKRTDEMFGWMVSSPTMENGKWNLI